VAGAAPDLESFTIAETPLLGTDSSAEAAKATERPNAIAKINFIIPVREHRTLSLR
jgi:hypothetical protein